MGLESPQPPQPDPITRLYTNWSVAYYAPRLLYTAIELRIPEILSRKSLDASQLAEATRTKPRLLAKVCNGLCALGVLQRSPNLRYSVTIIGMQLLTGVTNGPAHWITLHGGVFQDSWSGLLKSLKSGSIPFEEVHGKSYYDFIENNPAETATLVKSMRATSEALASKLAAAGGFERVQTLADIGGNQGDVLAHILNAHPKLRGILCDQPGIVTGATDVVAKAGLSDRVQIVAGDILLPMPFQADACLVSRVLYNWPDAEAVTILKNTAACLPVGGRVLVVDSVMPSNPSVSDAFQDLFLAVNFGAEARPRDSFEAMFTAAGLSLRRCERLDDFFSLLEAEKN